MKNKEDLTETSYPLWILIILLEIVVYLNFQLWKI